MNLDQDGIPLFVSALGGIMEAWLLGVFPDTPEKMVERINRFLQSYVYGMQMLQNTAGQRVQCPSALWDEVDSAVHSHAADCHDNTVDPQQDQVDASKETDGGQCEKWAEDHQKAQN